MGISKEVSDYVNRLIDFPKRCSEFLKFTARIDNWSDFHKYTHSNWPYKKLLDIFWTDPQLFCKLLGIGHDSSRTKKGYAVRYIQLKFLYQKGSEYVKAWFLHHFLDCAKKTLKRLSKKEVSYREILVSHPWFSLEDVLKKLRRLVVPAQEFYFIEDFVRAHWEEIREEILQDLGYYKKFWIEEK